MFERTSSSPAASGIEGAASGALARQVVAADIGFVDFFALATTIEVDRPTPEPTTAEECERIAEQQQDLLEEVDRELRRTDAARTEVLLSAYDASMRDLLHRFGPDRAHRGSLGAQAFFQSTGLRLGISPLQVAHRLDTAQTLRDRLPLIWQTYLTGESTWRAADLAVAQADGLDADRWADYDDEAALAVVETPASRLKAKLHLLRERLQDDTAGERAKQTRGRRKVVLDHGHDGEASLVATGPAIPLVGFDQALTKAAVAARMQPGETRTIGQLRFDILQDLLVEGIKQSADPNWAALAVPARKGVVPAPILTIPALSAQPLETASPSEVRGALDRGARAERIGRMGGPVGQRVRRCTTEPVGRGTRRVPTRGRRSLPVLT
jgi:hypothetical protein